jgi:hypothetical protein
MVSRIGVYWDIGVPEQCLQGQWRPTLNAYSFRKQFTYRPIYNTRNQFIDVFGTQKLLNLCDGSFCLNQTRQEFKNFECGVVYSF